MGLKVGIKATRSVLLCTRGGRSLRKRTRRGDAVNVGVLGLGHLGNVMAARVTSNGHDVWWGDVMPSKVDEIWAVARWQRQMWPTQPDRGLVHATVDG